MEVEFLAQAVASTLDPTHAQACKLGNILSREVETQQGTETQVGRCERRVLCLEVLEEILVDEVEIVLIDLPEVVTIGILTQLSQHDRHVVLADGTLATLFTQRLADVFDSLVARRCVKSKRSRLLGLVVELGFQ